MPEQIILLCPDLHEVGGIGLVSRLALAALQEQRGEVWSYGAKQAGETGWPVRYANRSKLRAAAWGVRAKPGAFVVAMHLHLAPLALPALRRGGRLAVFLHGVEAWEPLSKLRVSALQRADVLLANSQFTARQFRQHNPQFAETPIQICPLGVPPQEFPAGTPVAGRPFALIVGRLSAGERYKGHDQLLEIWKEVPDARLVIVGDGDDRPRLEAKARQLALGDAVTFRGKVTTAELAALYRDCQFFVMPSTHEGFGLVFLEAMQAGKACIGGRGAAEEVIQDGVTGIIVPPALPEAVGGLFRDPDRCATMGAARQRYLQEFTAAHFQQRLRAALGI